MLLPIINARETGLNIMRLRERAGMSVRDVQDCFGFNTPQAVYKWQNGKALPTLENMVALAYIFGVRVEDIVVTDYWEEK